MAVGGPHEYLYPVASTDADGHRKMLRWVNRHGTAGTHTYAGRTTHYRYARVDGDDGWEYWVSARGALNRRRADQPPAEAGPEQLRLDW
jgi:hypothetical protein